MPMLLASCVGVLLPLLAFTWLMATRSAPRIPPSVRVTVFGRIAGIEAIVAFAIAGVVVLKRARRLIDAAFLTLALVGAVVGNLIVKSALAGANPEPWNPSSGFALGFPSGTATGTSTIAAAFVILGWNTRWRWPLFCLSAGYALMVALSLVLSGANSPSDVLAGWTLSLAWVIALNVLRTLIAMRLDDDQRRNLS